MIDGDLFKDTEGGDFSMKLSVIDDEGGGG